MFQIFSKKEEVGLDTGLMLCGLIKSLTPDRVFTNDRIRVVAFKTADECGDCGVELRWLLIEFREDDGLWKPIFGFHETNLPKVIDVMRQTDEFLNCRK